MLKLVDAVEALQLVVVFATSVLAMAVLETVEFATVMSVKVAFAIVTTTTINAHAIEFAPRSVAGSRPTIVRMWERVRRAEEADEREYNEEVRVSEEHLCCWVL